MSGSIWVLRWGHRKERDKRVTTHVGLVARAFGARGMYLAGEDDKKVIRSLQRVTEEWGGPFDVQYVEEWRKLMKDWKKRGKIVHLTMYGVPVDDVAPKLREELEHGDLLVFVGAEKVPREVYEIADYNVAVGNQPHSEIAALAILLDRIFQGKELRRDFKGWKRKIIPQAKGKQVVQKKKV